MTANQTQNSPTESQNNKEMIGCYYCGATAEYVEIMARELNVADPICCEDTEHVVA